VGGQRAQGGKWKGSFAVEGKDYVSTRATRAQGRWAGQQGYKGGFIKRDLEGLYKMFIDIKGRVRAGGGRHKDLVL
jgi:hypothetical protein